MHSHTYRHTASNSQSESARRRIRRTSHAHPLYCSTNGCTTYLVADELNGVATCPVCGARRRLH